MQLEPEKGYLKTTLIYLILSSIWIFFSDAALEAIVKNPHYITQYQTYKGLGFVLITSLLIYQLTKKNYIQNLINYNKIRKIAFYDKTTNLPNKYLLKDKFEKWKKSGSKKIIAVYIDINNFRNVNDYFGHSFGDKVLREIGELLNKYTSDDVFLAKYESDEFIYLIKNKSIEEVEEFSLKILDELKKPIKFDLREFIPSATAGIAKTEKSDYVELLKKSYIALDNAKRTTNREPQVFKQEFLDFKKEILDIQRKLDSAIKNNEFEFFFQPIYDTSKDSVSSFEVLIRWPQDDGSFISPGKFIPISEKSGHIEQIDLLVIKNVIKLCEDYNYLIDDYDVSINISCRNINSQYFVEELKKILDNANINLSNLVFEITETALMDDFDSSVKFIKDIKEYGIKIALDDFGTGFSSLSYLSQLPIDILKLDRLFIDEFTLKNSKVIKSIIQLGHELNLKLIAEGIENYEQLNLIKEMNCDLMQGYYFSKPNNFNYIKNKYL